MMPEGCVFISRADVPPIPAKAARWAGTNGEVVYDQGPYRWRVLGDTLVAFMDYGGDRVKGRARQWKRLWVSDG
jgi:hypothetical protein